MSTGGTGPMGIGGFVFTPGGTTGTGSPLDPKGGNGGSGKPVVTDQKSCNCSVAGGEKTGGGVLLLLGLVLGVSRKRRNA